MYLCFLRRHPSARLVRPRHHPSARRVLPRRRLSRACFFKVMDVTSSRFRSSEYSAPFRRVTPRCYEHSADAAFRHGIVLRRVLHRSSCSPSLPSAAWIVLTSAILLLFLSSVRCASCGRCGINSPRTFSLRDVA